MTSSPLLLRLRPWLLFLTLVLPLPVVVVALAAVVAVGTAVLLCGAVMTGLAAQAAPALVLVVLAVRPVVPALVVLSGLVFTAAAVVLVAGTAGGNCVAPQLD